MRVTILWGGILLSVPFIIKKPIIGLLLYASGNIIRPEMLVWGTGGLQKFFIIIIGALFFSVSIRLGEYEIVKSICRPQLLLLLWFCLSLFVSIIFSQYDPPRAVYFAKEIFKVYIFCLLITIVVSSYNDIKLFLNTELLCITLLALWGIDQHFRGNPRLEGLGGDAYPDSNAIASVFVLFLPLAIRLMFDKEEIQLKLFNAKVLIDKIRLKIVGLIASLIIIFAIIFTQSRGGLLGCIAALIWFFFLSTNKAKIVFISFLSMIIILPLIPKETLERYSTIRSGIEDTDSLDFSAGSRILLAKAGLKIFHDNLLFGTGFESFKYAKMRYANSFSGENDYLVAYTFQDYKVGHNTYMKVLSETGIFGGAPFFLFILGTLYLNKKYRRKISIKPELEPERENLKSILSSVEAGLVGHLVSIFFIDMLVGMFLYVQVVNCMVIRNLLNSSNHGWPQSSI